MPAPTHIWQVPLTAGIDAACHTVAQAHGLAPTIDERNADTPLQELRYEDVVYEGAAAAVSLQYTARGLDAAYIFFTENDTARLLAQWRYLCQHLTTQHGPPHGATLALPDGVTEADPTAFRRQLDDGAFIYEAHWQWPAPPPATTYKLVLMLSGSYLLHLSLFVRDD